MLDRALDHLPHGPEFRFLDRLIELDPGKSGRGEYHLRGHETFLKGHFPGQPLLPGVLLIEASAQLAGVVAQCDPAIRPLPGLKLTALRAVKILGSAVPGQVISLSARVSARLENLIQAEVTAELEGKTILQGSITLSGDKPSPSS